MFMVIRPFLPASDPYQAIGFLVPTLHDSRPGRFVQLIDFNHFRTIGMRRSIEEGVNSRFVTGERVEALLKVSPCSRLIRRTCADPCAGNAKSYGIRCY